MTTQSLRLVLLSSLVAACAAEVEILPEPPREAFPTIAPEVTTPPALPRVVPTAALAAGVVRREPIVPIPRPRPGRGTCELGQEVSCFSPPVSLCSRGQEGTPACRPLMKVCRQLPDGRIGFDESACNTPLVVSLHETEPVEFTQPAGEFSIGTSKRTEWVSARTPWLGRDLDGSGCIEGQDELFGPSEDGLGNGFDSLANLENTGDGRIDQSDAIFSKLLLWADTNQDRACTKDEVSSLADAGVVALDVDQRTEPTRTSGSYEGEQATLWFRSAPGEPLRRGRLVDVYLLPLR